MGTMHGGMWLMGLLWLALAFGFAYIIWVMASKEASSTKLIGKLLVLVIVVLSLALLISGLYVSKARSGMYDGKGKMMMDKEMMDKCLKMQQKMK